MRAYFRIALIASLCTACSVGPDYKQPQIYSDIDLNKTIGISANPNLIINHQWYKTFNDEQLNSLIENGLKANPDVKNALEKLRQSRLQAKIVRADFAPTVNTQGEYVDAKNFQTPEIKTTSDYFTVGFDATWEIDIWGKTRRQNESTQAMLQAMSNNFDNVKITLRAEIAKAYINYRLNEKLLDVIKENYRLQTEIANIVKAKYNAGLADDLALNQAHSAQLQSQMQIPDFEIALHKAKNTLSTLTGRLADDLNLSKSDLLERIPQITSEGLTQLPADVIRARPDVQYYERYLAAQNAQVGVLMAQLFPNLTLNGLLGWQNNTLSPIFASPYEIYSLGGNLTMPLLNWGKIRNNIKIQESNVRQAYNDYQKALLAGTVDISNAIKNLKGQQNRLHYAKINRQTNKQILELSLSKYKNGLVDFSDILYAQENKLNADKEYCQTLAALYTGIAGFYKAIGF